MTFATLFKLKLILKHDIRGQELTLRVLYASEPLKCKQRMSVRMSFSATAGAKAFGDHVNIPN